MKPWWETWPERLDFELNQLQVAGIRVTKISKDATTGILELQLEHAISGHSMPLTVRFPAFFPYARFELLAPQLDLKHHQNPFQKNVCLIGRASENWDVDDTVVDFVVNRLPRAIAAANEDDTAKLQGLEIQQAEPQTAYYSYANDSSVLIDSSWEIPAAINRGTLLLGIEQFEQHSLRGAVLQVQDDSGHRLARLSPAIANLPSWERKTECQWIRLDALPHEANPKAFLNSILNQNRTLLATNPSRIQVLGIFFPEEIGWRKTGDGWMFVVRVPVERSGFRRGHYWQAYFARSSRVGETDVGARVPEFSTLRQKKVAVLGLGALGAPSALEFARAGIGEIRIMDGDIVEPATTVRWPMGLEAAGRSKVDVLSALIRANYPYTAVITANCMFGALPGLGGTDLNNYDKFLSGVDLIYDATAEAGIHYLLSEIARERRLPYVAISATPGAWGGRVVRILPNVTQGCWVCLREAITDGSIPSPPGDNVGTVQIAGCADPTFTGSNFELGHIALLGARFAVSTLCADSPDGFPDQDDVDVAVLTLREKRTLVLPSWTGHKLQRHPSCKNH